MPLVQLEVRNEFGLGDPELYRASLKNKDDPREILDGVAVAGLVGILRQLGDLAQFASDIFHDLHEQVMATSSRGHKLFTRIQHMEATLPLFEKAIQSQRSHIHFSYVAGSDWHADPRIKQSHLLSSDLPQFMMDSYEECRDPPHLYLLDKFDSAGTGACLKRYSDPSYFKRVWATSELEKAEKAQREKKAQKIKRKESQIKNGVQHGVSLSRRYSSSYLASPGNKEQHLPADATPTDTPISSKILESESIFTSYGSGTRLNHIEQVLDTNSSVMPDEIEHDMSSAFQFHMNQSGLPCDILDEPNGVGTYKQSPHSSMQEESAHKSPPVTWDEKIEILKPTSSTSYNGIRFIGTQYAEPVPLSFKQSSVELETSIEGTLDQNVPATLFNANRVDELASETDNYMDALNTLESETETDSECRVKQKMEASSNISSHMQHVIDSPTSDFSASESHDSKNENAPNSYDFIPTVSVEPVWLLNSVESLPDPDYYTGEETSAHISSDITRMESPEGVMNDNLPESSIFTSQSILTPATTTMSMSPNSTPVNNISVTPAANLWTNGNLLGLAPSKPQDFSVFNMSSENIVSSTSNSNSLGVTQLHRDGFAIKPGTDSSSNEMLSKKLNPITDIDNLRNESLCQKSFSLRAQSSSEFKKFQDVSSPTKTNHQNDGHSGGAELQDNDNSIESKPTESGKNPSDIAASISALAQRILNNSLQRKPSIGHAQYGDGNAAIIEPQDALPPTANKETLTGVVSEASSEEKAKNIKETPLKRSFSLISNLSGDSSPPLEHMKINVHPMNSLEAPKLKLEYASGNLQDNIEDLVFPSFHLLSGPNYQENGSESDDDTFCRSCPCTSEDHLSPRSDSNSELWVQENTSGGDNLEIYNDLCKLSLSSSSASSFKGFGQTSHMKLDTQSENLQAEKNMLYFPSGATVGLPAFDSFSSTIRNGLSDTLRFSPEISPSHSQNQLPPPPPLPPVQWRMMLKPSIIGKEDTAVSEIGEHFNALQTQRFNSHRQALEQYPGPPPFPGTSAFPVESSLNQELQKPNEKMQVNHVSHGKDLYIQEKEWPHQISKNDQQKSNKHREPKLACSNDQEVDEREELLHQIRNKTFNLRRISTAKPCFISQPATNINVAAILEKANAIRQAFVGSDDGDDEDNWSDS